MNLGLLRLIYAARIIDHFSIWSYLTWVYLEASGDRRI